MAQQAVPRGMGSVAVRKRKGKGLALAAVAALVLLGGVGYFLWIKREPLMEAIAEWRGKSPAIPTTAEPPPELPRPGVDKVASSTQEKSVPAAPPSSPPTTPVAKQQPVDSIATIKLPEPQPAGPAPGVMPEPVPEIVKAEPPMKATPSVEPVNNPPSVPVAVPVPSTTVTAPEPAPAPVPPRAMLVEDDEPAASTPTGNSAMPTVASINSNPVTTPGQALVEVGRSSAPESVSKGIVSSRAQVESALTSLGQPKIVGVPEEAKPALKGLLNFLGASSWDERLKFSMLPEQVEAKGRAYYQANPDGPIDVDEIHYLRHEMNPQVGGGMHGVFVLFQRAWEHEIPVMVEVRDGEPRVDWLTFVEFKDDMLSKFMANPSMEGRWRFHVALTRAHYFEDDIPNREEKDAFEIAPPMPTGKQMFAFTDKTSQLARKLASTITWDKMVTWAIVELEWRKDGGKNWVELTAVPQLNWYSSSGPAEEPKTTTISQPPAQAEGAAAPSAAVRSTIPAAIPQGR